MLNDTVFADYQNKLTSLVLRKEKEIKMSRITGKTSSLHLLEENTGTLQFSLYFWRNCYTNKILIKKVNQLFSTGIIQKLELERTKVNRLLKAENEDKTQILTMDHLDVCFATIMICLVLSCVVFLIECLCGYMSTAKSLILNQGPAC